MAIWAKLWPLAPFWANHYGGCCTWRGHGGTFPPIKTGNKGVGGTMRGNAAFPDAPFFRDIADGPGTGRAIWVHAEDGVRLRPGIGLEGAKTLF